MKGIRFYLDHATPADKRRGKHEGNVTAVFVEREYRLPDGCQEAVGAVYFYPDSPVASTAASWEYLRAKGKRVPERVAREIHPQLFGWLDRMEMEGGPNGS